MSKFRVSEKSLLEVRQSLQRIETELTEATAVSGCKWNIVFAEPPEPYYANVNDMVLVRYSTTLNRYPVYLPVAVEQNKGKMVGIKNTWAVADIALRLIAQDGQEIDNLGADGSGSYPADAWNVYIANRTFPALVCVSDGIHGWMSLGYYRTRGS